VFLSPDHVNEPAQPARLAAVLNPEKFQRHSKIAGFGVLVLKTKNHWTALTRAESLLLYFSTNEKSRQSRVLRFLYERRSKQLAPGRL
jgi:hypothetical protein